MANRQPNPTGSRKISFNVSEQYDIQDVVGEGAYGVVWYVDTSPKIMIWLTGVPIQLCAPQAIWSEGCHQEDYSL